MAGRLGTAPDLIDQAPRAKTIMPVAGDSPSTSQRSTSMSDSLPNDGSRTERSYSIACPAQAPNLA